VDAELGRSAEQLVPAAQTYVLTILPALSEDHPDVYDVVGADLLPYWDFLATVACVGVAFIAIPTAVAKPEQQDLICNVIQDCMETWNPSSHGAFENFLGHHTMFVKQGLTPPDAVGHWVWRNVAEHPAANAETKKAYESPRLARPTGWLIFNTFSTWWE
jgi:hypothetical protein